MKYLSVSEISKKWNISNRSVRNYCAHGQIPGAVLEGKIWKIPENSVKPARKQRAGKVSFDLLTRLKIEKESRIPNGIYQRIQLELTYNSNHIEGNRLSHEQTRFIYETNTLGIEKEKVNVDDVIETANHFRCVDQIIDLANYPLSESLIKQLHLLLKNGTSDSRKPYFAVGEYKRLENEVGGLPTTKPKDVHKAMKELINKYNQKKDKTFKGIVEFHYNFERIHPFQDGNGRIGRLIMFKECLRNNIVPFIIEDNIKDFYYRGLKEWKKEKGYLIDTCLSMQDKFKTYLDYFNIEYTK